MVAMSGDELRESMKGDSIFLSTTNVVLSGYFDNYIAIDKSQDGKCEQERMFFLSLNSFRMQEGRSSY
jgi:hypothetical protein